MQQKKLLIIGGGAAGIFCAVNAAIKNPKLKIIVLEKSNKLLSKVKVSGGGRCNVTHNCNSISQMAKCYPRGEKFLKKAFNHFFVNNTIEWFETRGVKLKIEADGRMFPTTNSSDTIINCFLNEVSTHNIEIIMSASVKSISEKLEVSYNNTTIKADYVCVATGGFPKIEQYEFLSAFKHNIIKPIPSLFTFNAKHTTNQLMGLAVKNTNLKIAGFDYVSSGSTLITHWGLSGPAVLKLSAYAAQYLFEKNYEYAITINWNNDFNETTMLEFLRNYRIANSSKKIAQSIFETIPNRLWIFLLQETNIDNTISWGNLPSKQQNTLAKTLCSYVINANGKTTFKEEFVTAGGIDTNEVDVNTMQSKLCKNLFFAGEILNIDGITGGYNFQNAWTTAFIVSQNF